ncbi:uncharacterized protein LOC125489591 [Plutella xylostella]|uniref:uncharacterized protein LOC125489591 n=1 Tax=Plutella xylostella TaxID=51655 RepID=UPI002032C94D|nr:uncharacterized protein LOC125489591 [Plutella xylostella]XP_048481786.1 uncharacterized protein LOC125489591 [Plutella xylostella]
MSLFVDLRQIKSSVTNLSEMVEKMSTSVEKDCPARGSQTEPPTARTSIFRPSLGLGVRFSSQEDVTRHMPSARLRSHMSLPELDKDDVFDKTRRDDRPTITEIIDDKSETRRGLNISTENLTEWIVASAQRRPHFDDGGAAHPMDFLADVRYYVSELHMPADKQLPFVVSCLDSVPLLWARCFRHEFSDIASFYKAFEQEFWGPERQKAVLYDLKLGKYDPSSGLSMSEYFLHKVCSYRHLAPPPSDLEVVYSLAAHYPAAVELELRLAPRPSLREAYAALRRREGAAADFLPNYLYEMCEAFQRGQRPESARKHEGSQSARTASEVPPKK